MREYKFRAWDKKDKHWWNTKRLVVRADGKIYHRFTGEVTDKVFLMQYTGLLDKNGKEIYEKDLVICYTKDGEKVYTHPQVVEIPEWHKLIWDETNTEVVGNIYENPKLIKQ